MKCVCAGPPELAVSLGVAEGGGAAAQGSGSLDDGLQGWALPHEAARFELLTRPRQPVCRRNITVHYIKLHYITLTLISKAILQNESASRSLEQTLRQTTEQVG